MLELIDEISNMTKRDMEEYLLPLVREERWKYATTYNETAPHEYILMEWNEQLFRALAHYIDVHGEDTTWHGQPTRHGHLGKYRYWHYHTYAQDSVMNRALDVPEKNGINYPQELRDKYMKKEYVQGEA